MSAALSLSLPERLSMAGLPGGLVEKFTKKLEGTWVPLANELRASRPEVDTTEERASLKRFVAFTLDVFQDNPEILSVLGTILEQGLDDLVRQELAEATVEKKLALRQLGSALETFAVSFQSVVTEMGPLLSELTSLSPAERDAASIDATLADPIGAAFVRVELDLLMATDSIRGSLDDLTYWCRRAAMSARRLEAVRMNLPLLVRADVARLRARRSWVDWTDDDIKQELSPWRDAGSSRPRTRRRSSR